MSPRVMVTVGQVSPWATQNPTAPALHMSSAWGPLQSQRLWVSGWWEFGRDRKKGAGGVLLCLPRSSCPPQTWQGLRQQQHGVGRGGLTTQTALNFCSASCSLQRALECSEDRHWDPSPEIYTEGGGAERTPPQVKLLKLSLFGQL